MKKVFLAGAFALSLSTGVFGQDVQQSNVPSVVVNSFQKSFPKANDVDWELEIDKYKVDFEIGVAGTDHEVWYDKSGKLLKHKEEISKADLPKAVQTKLASDFASYKVEDVKRISEGSKTNYSLELKSGQEEWKLVLDEKGTVLSKIAD